MDSIYLFVSSHIVTNLLQPKETKKRKRLQTLPVDEFVLVTKTSPSATTLSSMVNTLGQIVTMILFVANSTELICAAYICIYYYD